MQTIQFSLPNSHISTFIKCINYIQLYNDLVDFHFTNSNLIISTYDTCHVVMVRCQFFSPFFSSLQGEGTVGINLQHLTKRLTICKNEDYINFTYYKSTCKIQLNSNKFHFQFPSFNSDFENFNFPEDKLTLYTPIQISPDFTNGIAALHQLSCDTTTITINNHDNLMILSSDEESNTCSIKFPLDNSNTFPFSYCSSFSTRYLSYFTKLKSNKSSVSVAFYDRENIDDERSCFPLQLIHEFSQNGTNIASISTFVASKLEDF